MVGRLMKWRLTERCCDPSNREPNLSLNLELADYIKSKKANTYVQGERSGIAWEC